MFEDILFNSFSKLPMFGGPQVAQQQTPAYTMNLATTGEKNSGGWRYGNGGSNQFLYRNENVDNDLLRRAAEVAAPKGLLDTKIEAAPLDKFLQQDRSGGDGNIGNTPSNDPYGSFRDQNDQDNALGTTSTSSTKGLAGVLGAIGAGLLGFNPAIGKDLGVGLNGLIGSLNPATVPGGMAKAMRQMDEQVKENDSQYGGGYGDFSDTDMSAAMGQMDAQAAENDANRGYGGYSDSDRSGGFGADGNTNDGAGGYGGADNGYYKGGMVTPNRLAGANPKGPDDGYAALDHGEYVIKASAVKKYGKGLLDAINTEKFKG